MWWYQCPTANCGTAGWTGLKDQHVAACPTCKQGFNQQNVQPSPFASGTLNISATNLGSLYNLLAQHDTSATFGHTWNNGNLNLRQVVNGPGGGVNYQNVLDQAGIINALMKVASDAAQQYLNELRLAHAADFATCRTYADQGNRYFHGMRRDAAMWIFRDLKNGPQSDGAFFENAIRIQYLAKVSGTKQIPVWIVEQVWDYPENSASVEAVVQAGWMNNQQVAEASTANTTAESFTAVQGAHVPPAKLVPVQQFFAGLSLLKRSMEPARRLAAAPLYAIADYFWRKGVAGFNAEEMLHYHGKYSIMSHKGAAGKIKNYERGDPPPREYRKTKGKNIIHALLANADDTAGAAEVHDRSNGYYDMCELTKAVKYWLEQMNASPQFGTFTGQNVPARVNTVMAFYNVTTVPALQTRFTDRGGKGTLRMWQRREGPRLTNVGHATIQLQNLFVGLLIADNARWV